MGVIGKKRVLVVDDEERNRTLLEQMLQGTGYEIVLASGGRDALTKIAEQAPDLVLLDLRMPDLDGMDVLTHLRADDASNRIAVVLVTAHAERAHHLRALEAGADEFLEKPVDQAILLARVRTLLALKESQDALVASARELAMRNAALEQLQREQRDLTAFIVHDLKNPLAAVITNVVFLKRVLRHAEPTVLDALRDMDECGRRLNDMIQGLLLISRLEEPTFALQREEISVDSVLRDVAARFVKRAEERGITIEAPACESASASVDRNLFTRVVENILDNALRHTPRDGKVGVEVACREGVAITISNTGDAIPMSDRTRIFEKFARVGAGSGANVGLGLYFCRRAVEAHGGHIEVTQSADWPTSFVVHLPAT